jgi:transcriptional regulator with XRE-family HTH domain
MKRESTITGFGKRLAQLRKARGITQKELGEAIGVSNRVIAYYEKETNYPPAHLIVPLARALKVTTDELLGMTETTEEIGSQTAALWRKLKIVETLPRTDQRAILHYITMVAKNRGHESKSTDNQQKAKGG